MALSVTELRAGTTFRHQGQVHEVLRYQHIKQGRGGAVIRLRLRNLEKGAVTEQTFKNNERFEAVAVTPRLAQFLYRDERTYHFMDPKTFHQLALQSDQIDRLGQFLTEGTVVAVYLTDGQPIGVKLGSKVDLRVMETAPAVRRATLTRVSKPAKLETGLTIQVPEFINVGDRVRVNTETGEYVARV